MALRLLGDAGHKSTSFPNPSFPNSFQHPFQIHAGGAYTTCVIFLPIALLVKGPGIRTTLHLNEVSVTKFAKTFKSVPVAGVSARCN